MDAVINYLANYLFFILDFATCGTKVGASQHRLLLSLLKIKRNNKRLQFCINNRMVKLNRNTINKIERFFDGPILLKSILCLISNTLLVHYIKYEKVIHESIGVLNIIVRNPMSLAMF